MLDQFYILNLPELTSQIYSHSSYLKIVSFHGAFMNLSFATDRLLKVRLKNKINKRLEGAKDRKYADTIG